MAQIKVVDSNGLLYYHQKLKTVLATKVDKKVGFSLMSDAEITRLASVVNYDDTGVQNILTSLAGRIETLENGGYDDKELRGLIDGLRTDVNALKAKVENWDAAYEHSQAAHAPANAEKNTLVGIQKNGTDVTINTTTRKANIIVPTKTSELENDAGFVTSADIDTTQNHVHANKNVLDKVTQQSLDSWNTVEDKVDKVEGKGLSTNDLTTTLKQNYDKSYTHSQAAHAPASAQENVIEKIKVNGTEVTPNNKEIDIKIVTEIPPEYVTELELTAKGYALASNVYTKNDVYTKAEADAKHKGGVHAKGSVNTYAELPTDASEGDMYNVKTADPVHNVKAGDNLVFTSEGVWDNYSGIIDLTGYVSNTDVIDNETIDSWFTDNIVGQIDSENNITLNLPTGKYKLKYENGSGNVLEGYEEVTTMEV